MAKNESFKMILQYKVFLETTLTVDADFILQHVHQDKLITQRDYNNLSDISNRERKIIELLDKLMGKGEETCRKFIVLLGKDCILENVPKLKGHAIFASSEQEISEYKMTQNPRGICVIINNVIFDTKQERSGSDEDHKYLAKVFRWLGFQVLEHRNKSAFEMKNILRDVGKTVDGDCFVCCVLSHGESDGVFGTDGDLVSVDEIREPFTGVNCRKLVGKPKLFFIQACRGLKNQARVIAQADAAKDGVLEMEVDGDRFDITIPADTDFLVARSTTDGHLSYRKPEEGSWFIQSLCKNLEKHCPLGADILSILIRVNNEVSTKGFKAKQMPVQEVAMRKILILRPVNI